MSFCPSTSVKHRPIFIPLNWYRNPNINPKFERWAIITYKHGIYELSHELPNDLRRRILGN